MACRQQGGWKPWVFCTFAVTVYFHDQKCSLSLTLVLWHWGTLLMDTYLHDVFADCMSALLFNPCGYISTCNAMRLLHFCTPRQMLNHMIHFYMTLSPLTTLFVTTIVMISLLIFSFSMNSKIKIATTPNAFCAKMKKYVNIRSLWKVVQKLLCCYECILFSPKCYFAFVNLSSGAWPRAVCIIIQRGYRVE